MARDADVRACRHATDDNAGPQKATKTRRYKQRIGTGITEVLLTECFAPTQGQEFGANFGALGARGHHRITDWHPGYRL